MNTTFLYKLRSILSTASRVLRKLVTLVSYLI